MDYTYLKLQDKVLLKYNLSSAYYEIVEKELLPFVLRDTIVDTTQLKVVNPDIISMNTFAMFDFYETRSLSINRENAKFILNELGISQKNNLETKSKMMIMCNALSVADDYWITENPDEKWSEVNVRDNPINEDLAQIALLGKSISITGKVRTPELTSLGTYAKAWFKENGELYLYKASSKAGIEAEIEAMTSNILDCFNVPHVKYFLAKKEDKTVTKCKQLNNHQYSVVDAGDVASWCSKTGKDFLSLVKKIDSETYYKTIIVDYLCSNRDRHEGNWGFFMNNTTGELVSLHPLFDHNKCFDTEFMKDNTGGFCQLMPNKTQQEAALYAIEHCDFRCLKPVSKSVFVDKEMYNVFMKRAVELGVCKRQKKVLWQKKVKENCNELHIDAQK